MRQVILAYWWKRPESARDCAGRISLLLDRTREYPEIGEWLRPKARGKSPNMNMDVSAAAVERALLESATPELSADIPLGLPLTISAWSNASGGGASVLISCCSSGSMHEFWNSLNLEVNIEESGGSWAPAERFVRAIVGVVIEAMSPAWLVVTDRVGGRKKGICNLPSVGWMGYSSRARLTQAVDNRFHRVETTGSGGILLISTAQPFRVSDTEKVHLADSATEFLVSATTVDPRTIR